MELIELIEAHKNEFIARFNEELRPIALQNWTNYCLKVDTAIAEYQEKNPEREVPKQRNTDPAFREHVSSYLKGEEAKHPDALVVARTQMERAFFEWLTS